MNKRNNYRSLLKYANEDLAKKGVKIVLESEDNTFNLLIVKLDGSGAVEYACGFFEEKLADLVNDAWAWANRN